VEKHVSEIFSRLGLSEDQTISRRVHATLLYLSESGLRTCTPRPVGDQGAPPRAAAGGLPLGGDRLAAVLRARRDRLPQAGFRVPCARIVTQITEGFAVLR